MKLKRITKYALIIVGLIAVSIYFKVIYDAENSLFSLDYYDISNQSELKNYLGKKYETQIDLIIVRKRSRPFLYIEVPISSDMPSIEEIQKNESDLPYNFNQFTKVYGILPKGSIIEINGVLKSRIVKRGEVHESLPFLQGQIISGGNFSKKKVILIYLTNLFWGIDPEKNALKILERFALPIVDKSQQQNTNY